MSDGRHSPAPWYENVSAADSLELRSADGKVIAWWGYGSEPRTADFLLIKDAPETKREHGEMLDLLRRPTAELGWYDERDALVARIDARNAKR